MSDPSRRVRMRIQLPDRAAAEADLRERQPLLRRSETGISSETARANAHEAESGPMYSCVSNPNNHLPVYTNIHRIRRDVESVVEDYLSLEQLRDVRINMTVVRPLVDKLYELDDISIVYCLFVNRAQFLYQQSHLSNRQNVNFSRATLCELIATRILRRFSEDNHGPEGLLLLAHILVAGFEPFQSAPAAIREEAEQSTSWIYHKTLPALEVAILTESKYFLSSTPCQKVIDAIYEGRVIYTPSSFIDLIPDHYKQKPISFYEPREAPLLNQYRLIVPRTRNILEVMQYVILLLLYFVFMFERDASRFSILETFFAIYAFGWALDQFATVLEHGWHVYTQNLWSFLDVGFIMLYFAYIGLRLHGWRTGDIEPGQQALDVMAMAAPFLVPRLAFNLLSDNIVFLSLRAMMADFTILTLLAAWCFGGFLLSLQWLSEGRHTPITISKWMLWIWFGLDGTGIQRSTEFHWLLGPSLMVAFAFLGNTLFLTILVSMLSNTFAAIVSNATAEVQFRRAVLTLEGVKSDAIFAYQPPFNILAIFVFIPLKFIVSPRWFHKIHVATVRLVNLPLLLIIAFVERKLLGQPAQSARQRWPPKAKGQQWFWEKWRITAHRDIRAVFELSPPDCVEEVIAVDDDLTQNLIMKQFTRHASSVAVNQQAQSQAQAQAAKKARRRDSTFPGVPTKLRGSFSEAEDVTDLNSRLTALETTAARMVSMLEKLTGEGGDETASSSDSGEGDEKTHGEDGKDGEGGDEEGVGNGLSQYSGLGESSTLKDSYEEME